jgi:voltage-gated potassium channel
MNRFVRRGLIIGLLLCGLLAAGTMGFAIIEDYPWFDAFYMTVITITTVGYLEVHRLSDAGRLFNSILLLLGVITMFYIMGSVTQIVLDIEFSNYFGKRKVRKMVEKLRDHYIVCGIGRVGRGAAAELQRSGKPFVIVDRDENRVEWAIKQGMLAVQADCSQDETLRDLGIERAKGLIAALASDADNLYLTLSAKTMHPMLNIATRVSTEEAEAKMRRAGADAVFLPYTMTGYRLAQAILRPHVFEFFDVTASIHNMGLNVGVDQVEIEAGSNLVARSLRDLQLRRDLGVIVLAIRRASGAMEFNPPADALMQGGDHLIVMGDREAVHRLESMMGAGRA